MVTITIYKDAKSWRAKWKDQDVHFGEFYMGVGLAKKEKLVELFGPTLPVINVSDTPDKSTGDAVQRIMKHMAKVYASE